MRHASRGRSDGLVVYTGLPSQRQGLFSLETKTVDVVKGNGRKKNIKGKETGNLGERNWLASSGRRKSVSASEHDENYSLHHTSARATIVDS